MSNLTTVILVRHGQTPWNPVNKLRGRAHIPLTDFGMQQAAATGKYIAHFWQPDAVYVSPLTRTLQTAEQIIQACHYPHMKEHAGLLDIDFGAWTGLSPDDIQGQWPEAWQTWQHAPQDMQFPEGESLVEASVRAEAAFTDIVSKHTGETVFMVSHTAINRLILMRLLDIPLAHFWHLGQDTCAINVITCEGKTCTVDKVNMTHHLMGLA